MKAVEVLSRTNGATIKDLQEALDRKDKKAVYRMLEAIQEAGFPVYDDKIPGERSKRWRFEESYLQRMPNIDLPNFTLSFSDVVALQLLRSKVAAFKGTDIGDTLDKVFARLDALVPDRLSATFRKMEPLFVSSDKFAKDYSGKEDVLDSLVDAMLKQKTSIIRYNSFQQGKETGFKIDPLSFFEHNGGFYLFVRATSFGDIRMLALERIMEVTPLKDTFVEPKDFNPESYLQHSFGIVCDDPIHTTIKVSASQSRYIKERPFYSKQIVNEEPDGSLIIELKTSGRHDVINWILTMGTEASVLAPEELRLEIKEQLETMLKIYS